MQNKNGLSNKMHTKQRLKHEGKGKWLFTIPEVPEQVVVPWILSPRGEAVPIEPPEIVAAVRKVATAILDKITP